MSTRFLSPGSWRGLNLSQLACDRNRERMILLSWYKSAGRSKLSTKSSSLASPGKTWAVDCVYYMWMPVNARGNIDWFWTLFVYSRPVLLEINDAIVEGKYRCLYQGQNSSIHQGHEKRFLCLADLAIMWAIFAYSRMEVPRYRYEVLLHQGRSQRGGS